MSNKNNIKNKLDARELQPSPEAWNKLDAQLSEHVQSSSEKKVAKPYYKLWLKVAASIIIFILISVVFTIENEVPTSEHSVTHSEQAADKKQNNPTEKSPRMLEQRKQVPVAHPEPNMVREETSIEIKTQLEPSGKSTQVIAVKATTPHTPTSETKNTTEVVAIDSMHKPKRYDELPSADELLEQALLKRQANQESAIAVDSKKLLDAVEDDIFHEKSPDLLEKLTQQFKSLQVAIHERNEEK